MFLKNDSSLVQYFLSQVTNFIWKLKNDRGLFLEQFFYSCPVTSEIARPMMTYTESNKIVNIYIYFLKRTIKSDIRWCLCDHDSQMDVIISSSYF